MSWLFEPGTTDELVEGIYMHTLARAVFAAIGRAPTVRVTWPQDNESPPAPWTAAVPALGVQ